MPRCLAFTCLRSVRSALTGSLAAILLLSSPLRAAAEWVVRFEASGTINATGFPAPDAAGLDGATYVISAIASIDDATSTSSSPTGSFTQYPIVAGILELSGTVGGANDGLYELTPSGALLDLFSPNSSSDDDSFTTSTNFTIGGTLVNFGYLVEFDGNDHFDSIGSELQMRAFTPADPTTVIGFGGDGDTTYTFSSAIIAATDSLVNVLDYAFSGTLERTYGTDYDGIDGADFEISGLLDGASPVASGVAGSRLYQDFPFRTLQLELSNTVGGANDGTFGGGLGTPIRLYSGSDPLVGDELFTQGFFFGVLASFFSQTVRFADNDFFPDSPPRLAPFLPSDTNAVLGGVTYPVGFDAEFGYVDASARLNPAPNPGITHTLSGRFDRTAGTDSLGIDGADFVLTTIVDTTSPAATAAGGGSDLAIYLSLSQILDVSGSVGGLADGRYVARSRLGHVEVDAMAGVGVIDVSTSVEILATTFSIEYQLVFGGGFLSGVPPEFPEFEDTDVIVVLGEAEYPGNQFDLVMTAAEAAPEPGLSVGLAIAGIWTLGLARRRRRLSIA